MITSTAVALKKIQWGDVAIEALGSGMTGITSASAALVLMPDTVKGLGYYTVAIFAAGQFRTGNAFFEFAQKKNHWHKSEPRLIAVFLSQLLASILVGRFNKPLVDYVQGYSKENDQYSVPIIMELSLIIAVAATIQHIILKTDLI